MMIQTRNAEGELKYWYTLKEAFEHSREDTTVSKISFDTDGDNERVRLVKTDIGWVYESVLGNRELPWVERYPVGSKIAFSHRGFNFIGMVDRIDGTTYHIKCDYPYPNTDFAIVSGQITRKLSRKDD